MHIGTVRIDGLRNLRGVDIDLSPAFNLVLGRNGAGKTSLIEALHLFAHGRSFRAGQIDSLSRHGEAGFSCFVRVIDGEGRMRELGMQRAKAGWTLVSQGSAVPTLVEFVRSLAIITLEPETHALITGPAEGRRRYLDWLLFHVEPDFLETWRRYLRALRQRNAALRQRTSDVDMLRVWEPELAAAGELIDRYRRHLLDALTVHLHPLLRWLLPGVEAAGVRYRSGWPSGQSLHEALQAGRETDRDRGFTQRGPHRSDWRLDYPGLSQQSQLSRGQAKLTAIACLLAQALHFRALIGTWPILACDDLASELDSSHQDLIMEWLQANGPQVVISGTEEPRGWSAWLPGSTRRFHVEQGQIARLL